ncbi:CPBP family intramembrane metalloprotease [Natrarchaeobius halalkaliphilus]|uniref:CPBP family intramembrane metalloprotease n=1 Tax=Natrarchaeobius halalkaliphilus TaxID=1679091 RepID=A0A3N6NWK5_9EURY|nr:type II CAAX endopeptidase family protein [Natrarchaeobius halalkaliphilus]RQG88929.1 CPBP family intramembrane metalloprotease [Natrarchaeobius halalkaliphilus]
MPQWTAFVAITCVVLALLLVLSYLTQSTLSDPQSPDSGREDNSEGVLESTGSPLNRAESEAVRSGSSASETATPRQRDSETETPGEKPDSTPEANSRSTPEADVERPLERRRDDTAPERKSDETTLETETAEPIPAEMANEIDPESLSTGAMLANVALSQGLFAFVLIGAILYTGIPADALGLEFSRSYLEAGLVLGVAAGVVLYVANELGAAIATRFGFDHDERLRALLAPDSGGGWLVLLAVVLPIIALFEELLFRAALIGVVAAGFGISPWLLAVLSSIAFAVGHGMQGSVGIVVTGLLGFVLAGIFILTESLLVVVVAHYLINALEFVVHEGFEFEWAKPLER